MSWQVWVFGPLITLEVVALHRMLCHFEPGIVSWIDRFVARHRGDQ